MSAWLCEKKLLSLVTDVVKSEGFKEYDKGGYSDKSEDELIKALSEINTTNLHYLYEEFPSEAEQNIINDLEYVALDESDAQKYMSVRSFIYQSCDCNENKGNDLYNGICSWAEAHSGLYDDLLDDCLWDIDAVYD